MRSSQHSGGNRIETILSVAARRRALAIAVEQAASAMAVVLAGAVLMLLAGTQILAWYWLAVLGVSGAAIVIVRVHSRPIPRYRLAQILDGRLKLSDSLSTAWFLLSHSRRDDPVARLQIERAEQIAGSVRPAAAFPFSGNRSWAVAGVLAALAFSLFAVRYLVTRSLSLEQALVPIHLGSVLQALEEPFSGGANRLTSQVVTGRQGAQSAPQDGRIDTSRPREGKAGNSAAVSSGEATSQGSQSQADSTDMSAGRTSDTQAAHNGRPPQPDGHDRASQEPPQADQASAQQSSSALLDKMKDALASLVSKMRPSGNSKQPTRGDANPEERKSSAQAGLGKDQQGNQQNARGDRASQEQSTEGQAQGQTTEKKAQASQARNSNQSSEHKGSDSQSGVGRQDGEKDIKEAEQLRAMGKLAEIIGKRSADLTGEMTIETRAGKQELKTEYSQRMGRHSDAGGEINRDEIPLIYQQYIRDYMEEVRKQEATPHPP